MPRRVRFHFMALLQQAGYQVRVGFGFGSDHKEGAPDPTRLQRVQHRRRGIGIRSVIEGERKTLVCPRSLPHDAQIEPLHQQVRQPDIDSPHCAQKPSHLNPRPVFACSDDHGPLTTHH